MTKAIGIEVRKKAAIVRAWRWLAELLGGGPRDVLALCPEFPPEVAVGGVFGHFQLQHQQRACGHGWNHPRRGRRNPEARAYN